MRSSSTMSPMAIASRMASSVCSTVSGTTTPLPPARPDCLTTTGRANVLHQAIAASGSPRAKWANCGPGRCNDSASWRANALDDSSWATCMVGPKTRMLFAASASLSPAASDASGPMTTRSMRSLTHSRTNSSTLVEAMWCRSPGMPPLPGATSSRLHRGDASTLLASACSRAPLPTTRTVIASLGIVTQAPCRTCLFYDAKKSGWGSRQ